MSNHEELLARLETKELPTSAGWDLQRAWDAAAEIREGDKQLVRVQELHTGLMKAADAKNDELLAQLEAALAWKSMSVTELAEGNPSLKAYSDELEAKWQDERKAREEAECGRQAYRDLVHAMDVQATKLTHTEGDEEIIHGYQFNTGLFHALLGLLAGANHG